MPDPVVYTGTAGSVATQPGFPTSANTSTWPWLFDMPDDPDGLAGVREPRRPLPTQPSTSQEVAHG
jgi:hypothetical protein